MSYLAYAEMNFISENNQFYGFQFFIIIIIEMPFSDAFNVRFNTNGHQMSQFILRKRFFFKSFAIPHEWK